MCKVSIVYSMCVCETIHLYLCDYIVYQNHRFQKKNAIIRSGYDDSSLRNRVRVLILIPYKNENIFLAAWNWRIAKFRSLSTKLIAGKLLLHKYRGVNVHWLSTVPKNIMFLDYVCFYVTVRCNRPGLAWIGRWCRVPGLLRSRRWRRSADTSPAPCSPASGGTQALAWKNEGNFKKTKNPTMEILMAQLS